MKSRTGEPTLVEIFSDSRYIACSVFLVLSAAINQLSGINAINIYSSSITDKINGLPPDLPVYLLAAANLLGALMGPFVQKCFSIRTMLIAG